MAQTTNAAVPIITKKRTGSNSLAMLDGDSDVPFLLASSNLELTIHSGGAPPNKGHNPPF
jgi:hypothetical protein